MSLVPFQIEAPMTKPRTAVIPRDLPEEALLAAAARSVGPIRASTRDSPGFPHASKLG